MTQSARATTNFVFTMVEQLKILHQKFKGLEKWQIDVDDELNAYISDVKKRPLWMQPALEESIERLELGAYLQKLQSCDKALALLQVQDGPVLIFSEWLPWTLTSDCEKKIKPITQSYFGGKSWLTPDPHNDPFNHYGRSNVAKREYLEYRAARKEAFRENRSAFRKHSLSENINGLSVIEQQLFMRLVFALYPEIEALVSSSYSLSKTEETSKVFDIIHSSEDKVDLSQALSKLNHSEQQATLEYFFVYVSQTAGGKKPITELNLASNQLTMVPESIGCLTNLKVLDLQHNNLTALPIKMARLPSELCLSISGNNISYPSDEVIVNGFKAGIKPYLQDVIDATRLREVRGAHTLGRLAQICKGLYKFVNRKTFISSVSSQQSESTSLGMLGLIPNEVIENVALFAAELPLEKAQYIHSDAFESKSKEQKLEAYLKDCVPDWQERTKEERARQLQTAEVQQPQSSCSVM